MSSLSSRAVRSYLGVRRHLPRRLDHHEPPRSLRPRVIRRNLGESGQFHVDRMMPEPAGSLTVGTAVVYFHGGSFTAGLQPRHWSLVGDLADATGAPVYVPRYGRAPEHTAVEVGELVDAVVDHIACWDAARDEQVGGADAPGRVRIVLAGDSAGGNLALVAAQRLRGDERIAGLVLISPWVDVATDHPGIAAVDDPWLQVEDLREAGRAWAGGLPLDDPRVSPLHGDLSGLAPIDLFGGTDDVCWPDALLLAERAREAGTEVTVHAAEGQVHDHVLMPTPEGRGDRATLLGVARQRLRG